MSDALSLETLQRQAPSIFCENSAARTSEKYQHISTVKVIEGLINEGFIPTWAKQSQCRDANNLVYTKHTLRFRHQNARPTSSGLYPEIVLINSHDGLSSYRLIAGVYRIVCANGLIAGNSYAEIRVRHQGDIVRKVIEGTYTVIENSCKMIESTSVMSKINLNDTEKAAFAEEAHTLRFEDNETGKKIAPSKLLIPRRNADIGNDLFSVFNVIQENLIKGGLRGYTTDKRGYPKRISTRGIKSIDQDTRLNKALWTLAEKQMQLKLN